MTPQLVAHRGYRLHYPENTLPAVDAAIAAGARFVEVDIQLSRDLVPVLFHDATLDRICGVSGSIWDYTVAELKKFHARELDRFGYKYAHVRIPTLQELVELLQRHPHVTVFIELKRKSLSHFGAAQVLERVLPLLAPLGNRAVLISYDTRALLAARQLKWPRVGVVLERWRDRNAPIVSTIAPEYLFADADDVPRFGALRASGTTAKLVIFEVADPVSARRLHKRGADFIETFAIGEMKHALESFR